MKKTLSYFSMAALVFMGAMMTGCTSNELVNEQPVINNNKVALTTTVSLDNGATKALTAAGVKTFAAGEMMALIYKNTSGTTVKAVSDVLQDNGDITNSGKSAKFTFELNDPDRTKGVTYIYPAAMANSDGSINYAALNSQNGTLDNVSSNLDLATYTGTWDGTSLPAATLDNQLAILVLTLKNDAGGSEITSSITGMTVSDGTYSYNVTRSAVAGPIYIAIRPMTSKNIEVTATDGTKTFVKALSAKTYDPNNGYELSWRMAEVIKGKFSVSSTQQVYFSKSNLRANYINSAWSWGFAPNQWDRVGSASANINITGNGSVSTGGYVYVDLFGWSTSASHLGIHSSTTDGTYSGDFVDWGSASEVTATIGTGWRTLTSNEWRYLLVTRTTSSGKHYCKAQVGEHPGVILIPDNWSNTYGLAKCDVVNLAFNASDIDKISLDDWNSTFAPNGAVFLPTTGQREGTSVTNENGRAYYWSATGTSDTQANQMYILGNAVAPDAGAGRHNGNAVRLVRNVK